MLGGRAPGHWPETKHGANNNADGMLYAPQQTHRYRVICGVLLHTSLIG
jgi:hypothetical protein